VAAAEAPPPGGDARGAESVTVIDARSSPRWLDVREIWTSRELLYFLVWRDVKVRYKQTALGVAWAVIQPVVTMVIFTLIFSRAAGIETGDLPYPVFAYAGLVAWTVFANAVTAASNSLVVNERLVSKTYFPRILLPLSGVLAGLPDLLISSLVLVALLLLYGLAPTVAILFLLPVVLLLLLCAAAVGTMLAALHVEYRDIRFATPFLLQVWLFLTPVAYPTDLVPEAWRPVYALNPMVGVVDAFRWSVTGARSLPWAEVGIALAVIGAWCVAAAGYFRRVERRFADVI
jgi:lipopolysaccharide transport system permease protein